MCAVGPGQGAINTNPGSFERRSNCIALSELAAEVARKLLRYPTAPATLIGLPLKTALAALVQYPGLTQSAYSEAYRQ
jgi:hypothetical protein